MKGTKELRTNKGITLIALVITIIVMLILVGVTISMSVNGGLFDYAGKASGQTKNAIKAEGQLADGGIEVDGQWYNSIDEYLETKNGEEKVETISKTESYVGCYADVDGNGTVDGVIYADLAFSKEATYWYGYSYEAVAAEDLKDYYISGTYDGDFNEEGEPKEVLTATGDGEDRFYVMALEDVTTADYTTFYWYYNAYGNMDASDTSTEFGTGKTNTATIKGIWDANTETPYGTQNARDLWAQIDLTNGWFVPSDSEWDAFADVFDLIYDSSSGEPGNDYTNFSLSDGYWSSSIAGPTISGTVRIQNEYFDIDEITYVWNVRLSTTF